MKYNILSLGPARMDVFVNLPEGEVNEVCGIDKKRCMIELGFGDKIAVSGMDFSIGGNAGNNATGISRLGMTAAIVGSIGDGWADDEVLKVLREEKVETKYIQKQSGQKGFGVIINYQGERTILSYYSSSLCGWPDDNELQADWIYLTSMGEGFEDFYKQAVAWAVGHNVKIAFNPGTRQLKVGLEALRYAYERSEILFVNREEGVLLLGQQGRLEIKEELRLLKDIGPRIVVVTDGPEGTYAYDGIKMWYMPIVPAPVVERTGTGDAFGSGFLAAIMSGKATEEALKWGTVNSASVLGYIGPVAGLLTPAKMQEWLEKTENVKVEEI